MAGDRGPVKDEAERTAPVVFRYLDARRFLGDYYRYKKATGRSFSYRAFSRKVGLGSPNYLKLVIDGERNLSPEMAGRFAAAAGLEGTAHTYFVDLVAFTQARTTDEKAGCYERLVRFREHREVFHIDLAYGQYHREWYIPALRELAFCEGFRADPAWIAARMLPPIREDQARTGLELLQELDMLTCDADGRWRPSDPLVSTGPEVKGLHYVQYHRTMIGRALRALDDLPPEERDISSVTLALDADGIARLKERLRRFRRDLLQLSAEEASPHRVVQVNLQLFPLTSVDAGAGDVPPEPGESDAS